LEKNLHINDTFSPYYSILLPAKTKTITCFKPNGESTVAIDNNHHHPLFTSHFLQKRAFHFSLHTKKTSKSTVAIQKFIRPNVLAFNLSAQRTPSQCFFTLLASDKFH